MPQQRGAATDAPPGGPSGPDDGVTWAVAAPRLSSAAFLRSAAARAARLLPAPGGTPFTFGYAGVLAGTSLIALYAPEGPVDALLQGSSTDVAHLVHTPLLVLTSSALWVAGGIASPYMVLFLLVLTALERRLGGLRAAGVFLFGHVTATLATEATVGVAVLAGRLPDTSLHRLDYGISFGVAAGVGALSGLLPPWLRWPLLGGFLTLVLQDLLAYTDPMTSWGHLLSVALGTAIWPLVRRWHRERREQRERRACGAGIERPAPVVVG
ncbi:hypothetical protein P3H78_04655 [Streptomyces sp. K1PA1]|uniref:Integral membrane protein n=2 Tax=Streptomyces tropicalis TaxID=3034234 RepID=A0ABT6A0M4_9ACTN|nr:hypothetical protein [Streptomyces tropicalis]